MVWKFVVVVDSEFAEMVRDRESEFDEKELINSICIVMR